MYFVTEGINIMAIPPSPNSGSIAAPGQCIILNKTPNTVKEPNNAPEINVSFFIFYLSLYCIPTHLAFRLRPVFLWSLVSTFYLCLD